LDICKNNNGRDHRSANRSLILQPRSRHPIRGLKHWPKQHGLSNRQKPKEPPEMAVLYGLDHGTIRTEMSLVLILVTIQRRRRRGSEVSQTGPSAPMNGRRELHGRTCSVVNVSTRFRVSRLACLTSDELRSGLKSTH